MILVVGQPRTGTSLMMQTLRLLGINLHGNKFPKGRDRALNLKGYWEDSRLLSCNLGSLDMQDGESAVKVNLRKFTERYVEGDHLNKVICCTRNLRDSAASQKRLNSKLSSILESRLVAHDRRVYRKFALMSLDSFIYVDYDDMLANPNYEIPLIASYLGLSVSATNAISNVAN